MLNCRPCLTPLESLVSVCVRRNHNQCNSVYYDVIAFEGEDFNILNNMVVFEINATNGTIECVDFAQTTQDMILEGEHHFLVVINSTDPEINFDYYYLPVYINDSDSEYHVLIFPSSIFLEV